MADDFPVITLSDVQSLLSQLDLPTDASLEEAASNFQLSAAGTNASVNPLADPQTQAHATPAVFAVPACADPAESPRTAVAAAPISPAGPHGPPTLTMHAPMQVPQVGAGSPHVRSPRQTPTAGAGEVGASPRGKAQVAYREKVFGSLRVLLDLCVHGAAESSNPTNPGP